MSGSSGIGLPVRSRRKYKGMRDCVRRPHTRRGRRVLAVCSLGEIRSVHPRAAGRSRHRARARLRRVPLQRYPPPDINGYFHCSDDLIERRGHAHDLGTLIRNPKRRPRHESANKGGTGPARLVRRHLRGQPHQRPVLPRRPGRRPAAGEKRDRDTATAPAHRLVTDGPPLRPAPPDSLWPPTKKAERS